MSRMEWDLYTQIRFERRKGTIAATPKAAASATASSTSTAEAKEKSAYRSVGNCCPYFTANEIGRLFTPI